MMSKVCEHNPVVLCYSRNEVLEAIRVALCVQTGKEYTFDNPGFQTVNTCLDLFFNRSYDLRHALAKLEKYFHELHRAGASDEERFWISIIDFTDAPDNFTLCAVPSKALKRNPITRIQTERVFPLLEGTKSSRMYISVGFSFPKSAPETNARKIRLVAARMQKHVSVDSLGYAIRIPPDRSKKSYIDFKRVISILEKKCNVRIGVTPEEAASRVSLGLDNGGVLRDFGSFQLRVISPTLSDCITYSSASRIIRDHSSSGDLHKGDFFTIGCARARHATRFMALPINEESVAVAHALVERLAPFKSAYENSWW